VSRSNRVAGTDPEGQPQLPHHRTSRHAERRSGYGGSGRTIRVAPQRTMRHDGHTPDTPCFPAESSDPPTRLFGVTVGDRGPVVGYQPTGSALPDTGLPRCAVLWRLLTSQGISSLGSPQIRACCFPARPPHLPPWLNHRASLCCASSPAHVGLLCDFCPSAHRFPIACLPTVGYPSAVGFW